MVSSRKRTTGDRAAKLNRRYFSERLVKAFMPTSSKILATSQFYYNAPEREFSAMASDLGWPPGYFPTSITLKSDRTGDSRIFLQLPAEDTDGEFVRYKCKDESLTITIFND